MANRDTDLDVKVIKQEGNKLTLQITVDMDGETFLETEQKILSACNAIGNQATEEALKAKDTDGSPIVVNGKTLTSKGKINKVYQTPYGQIELRRTVYQSSAGGKTYCPLDVDSHLLHDCTPRFAQMMCYKYGCMNARQTCADLLDNHDRKVNLSFLQNVSDTVGAIAQATEESWSYEIPQMNCPVHTVAMSLDGALLLTCDTGWRESMVGSISLYDKEGERLHSIYFGASPEYGKATFKRRFDREAEHVKSLYPTAHCVGIADGAPDNWSLLAQYTDHQILDFYHATEHLSSAAEAAHPEKTGKPGREKWLEEQCHRLKHDVGGAEQVLEELRRLSHRYKLREVAKEQVKDAVRYFENHLHMMDYARYREKCWPIGSGVTEAACKTLIKQRFCGSGMRWKERGIKTVLSLRSLILTKARWGQFWERVMLEKGIMLGLATS